MIQAFVEWMNSTMEVPNIWLLFLAAFILCTFIILFFNDKKGA